MSALLQMGHDSINLVDEDELDAFAGVILSPINVEPPDLSKHLARIRKAGNKMILFDPQLYFPRTNRGHLQKYEYFPSDLDTSDFSEVWWDKKLESLAEYGKLIDIDLIASPVVKPNVFSEDFYGNCAANAKSLSEKLEGNRGVALTLLVDHNALKDKDAAHTIASVVTDRLPDMYHIVLLTDVDPRRELADPETLFAMMTLAHDLSLTGKPVVVANCGAEMLLYKYAGASHCAAGKYFNLRRFSPDRLQDKDDDGGGGSAGYWFADGLLAFLRYADMLLIRKEGFGHLLESGYSNNMWSTRIRENFETDKPSAAIADGWRQFLCWFAQTETHFDGTDRDGEIPDRLKAAEDAWTALEDAKILLFEKRNDGSWLRPWRQALNAFDKALGR